MAPRQRFIHPDIWKDPVFGRMQPLEQVLFIGLFSIADDEGRTNADPAYLRSELFAYTDYNSKKVQAIRDSVVSKVRSVFLYRANDVDLIALLKWTEYQKPKYAKPSKLPPPFPHLSPKLDPSVPQASPESVHGLGREGLGLDRAVVDEPPMADQTAEEQRPPDFTIPKLKGVAVA